MLGYGGWGWIKGPPPVLHNMINDLKTSVGGLTSFRQAGCLMDSRQGPGRRMLGGMKKVMADKGALEMGCQGDKRGGQWRRTQPVNQSVSQSADQAHGDNHMSILEERHRKRADARLLFNHATKRDAQIATPSGSKIL